MNQEIQAEETYTPESYRQYTAALDEAQSVYDGIFSASDEIKEVQEKLQNALNGLHPLPDKDPLISAVITAKQIDTTAYIPTSVDPLSSALQHANSVISNENATQSDVDTATKNLENCINGLVKATNGIYKIFYSLTLIDSNSVGNEWSKSITCNGSLIESGDTVAVPLNSAITITGTVTEHDSVPDYGSGSIRLTSDNSTQSKTIYVRENRGRYSGNLAVWQLEGSIVLLSTQ
ncbi:MAG: FIVAR domain-containing protein [Oscillospiraceae bacterium]|nr:FIVAR domain-containing protein [Oscillospiraceae bacterium]